MIHDLPPGDKVKAILWVPVIRLWGDLAKMVGYPVGLFWRLRHADHIHRGRTSH
jgi:hypothetical protein